MLRKIPYDPGYTQQELALLRECLLKLIAAPPTQETARSGVCGTLDYLLRNVGYSKGYHLEMCGYTFCGYSAYSWEHTRFTEDGDPHAYFIDTKGYPDSWVGRGLELRIDFMKHCLGVVAKLEEALPV